MNKLKQLLVSAIGMASGMPPEVFPVAQRRKHNYIKPSISAAKAKEIREWNKEVEEAKRAKKARKFK